METTVSIVVALAAGALYGAGALRCWVELRREGEPTGLARALGLLALAAQVASVVVVSVARGRATFLGGAPNSLGYFAVFVAVVYLVSGLRYRGPSWGALLLPVASLAALGSGVWLFVRGGRPGSSFGLSWGLVHVIPTVLGFACLAAAGAVAAMYLLEEWYLRSRRLVHTLKWLPALDVLDDLLAKVFRLAFVLLGFGLISGTVRAFVDKGLSLGWVVDPKVLCAVATWLLVTAVLVVKRYGSFVGRRLTYVTLAIAALAAFAYVGVDIWLGGWHAGH